MVNDDKKAIPIKEGFWTERSTGNEDIQLIGSKCSSCGEIFFPKKEKGWCIHCQQKALEDIMLSRRGKLASFSVVMQQPGGEFYSGPVPYAYGVVDLPEGVRVESLLSTDDFDRLEVGKDVELVIEKLGDDKEGNEVVTFKFTPVS